MSIFRPQNIRHASTSSAARAGRGRNIIKIEQHLSSKRVKYGDADYEDTLLKWFEEVSSDDRICDADTVEDETVIETEVSDSENSSESV
nr:unnamed protein product [Callosobruchus chinensis]